MIEGLPIQIETHLYIIEKLPAQIENHSYPIKGLPAQIEKQFHSGIKTAIGFSYLTFLHFPVAHLYAIFVSR